MSHVTTVDWKYSAKVLGGIKQSVLAEEILFISSNGYLAPLLFAGLCEAVILWSLEITRTLHRAEEPSQSFTFFTQLNAQSFVGKVVDNRKHKNNLSMTVFISWLSAVGVKLIEIIISHKKV